MNIALRVVLLALLALACARPALAAEPSTIVLRDGTTITGEILSLSGGVYTVQSTTLGTIHITASDVRTVSNGPQPEVPAAAAGNQGAPAPAAPTQLDDLQQRMASDPDTMRDINALQDTPEMRDLLDDPAVLEALRSGNLEALLSNPKLARLAADPRIQKIADKYGH